MIVAGVLCTAGYPASAEHFPPATATPVKNVLDPILHNYQKDVFKECDSECEIVGPGVNSNVLIEHVSCQFTMSSVGVVTSATLTYENSHSLNSLPVFSYATVNSQTVWAINADTQMLYSTKIGFGNPTIYIFTSGANPGAVNCTLSGYYE